MRLSLSVANDGTVTEDFHFWYGEVRDRVGRYAAPGPRDD